MGANDGRVDEHATQFAELGLVGEEAEELLEAAGRDPSSEAIVDRFPSPEVAWEIAPGNACATYVEKGFKEHPVGELGLGSAFVSAGLLDEGFENAPKGIGEHEPHGILPRG
jgi:hypothetical protein